MKNATVREILPVIGCQVVFGALIQLGFALAGKWNMAVLLGGIIGCAVAVGYYLSIMLVTSAAAKKAQAQDVQGAQALMKGAYPLRLLLTFGVLLVCCISKLFNVLALLLPMLLVQPSILIADRLFGKGADK